ncbi:MAG: O-antigen ligase family protein [Solirubrobacteraceae bacterium]
MSDLAPPPTPSHPLTREGRRLGGIARGDWLVLLPAAVTVAVLVAWTATGGGYESLPTLGGGYDPGPWYLGALTLVGLACATVLGSSRMNVSRWTAAATAALGGYVVWSFLSISWAHDQGSAFLGSNRALVYLAVFMTFAILPWRALTLRASLGLLVAGFGAIALVTAVRMGVLADPSKLYLEARLIYPLGYYNADAALFTLTAFVAVALSADRDAPAALRVIGLTIAALCLQLAVLGQSRGWLFSLPIMLLLALLVVPGRVRLLLFALLPALATAVAAPTLLDVYSRATVDGVTLPQPHLAHVLHNQGSQAARAMLIADVTLAILATALVLLDRRVELSASAARTVNRLAAGVACIAVLVGVAAGVAATHGHPVGRIESAWRSFANSSNTANGSSRFTKLGSERVDMWRVALHEFANHPLTGIGQDNFAAAYLRNRRTDQEPRWVHSVELRMLTHTGVVGGLLFLLFLAATLLGALLGTRRLRAERAAAGIALLAGVVWLVYGSIDWFWEFPALSVPAFAFAGAAAALGRPRQLPFGQGSAEPAARTGERSEHTRLPIVAGRATAALLGGAAIATLVVSFMAARETQKATEVWGSQPARAYKELRSASSLLPFDAQIYLVGGAIALNSEEPAQARRWLGEAQQRDDEGWLAPFLLGVLDGEQGRRAPARAELARASELNPSEPLVGQALDRVSSSHPLTFEEAQILLGARQQARFGR